MDKKEIIRTLKKIHHKCSIIMPLILLGKIILWLPAYIRYNFNYFTVAKKLANNRFLIKWYQRWPCLFDATGFTDFDHQYVYHTSWAARVIAELKPEYHTDISSSLYFAGIASATTPIRFYDYRPADLKLPGLYCGKADITNLPFEDNSLPSLSCMHVMEHIGLGRYGDPFDHLGDLKGIAELKRVLVYGGHLVFVVPIGGVARLYFNAHRIYTFAQIKEYFAGFELKEFSFITDSGDFVEHACEDDVKDQVYGCGCFLFQKIR